MSDITGFPMVTVILDEPLDAGPATPHRAAVADRVTDVEATEPSEPLTASAAPENQALCKKILRAMRDPEGTSPVILLVATHSSPYLDEAARLVSSAFAACQKDLVALADMSPDAVVTQNLGAEPRNTVAALAQGKTDAKQLVVQTAFPGLCLLSAGGSQVPERDVPALFTRLRSAFHLVIIYGGPADSTRLKPLRRHADGCVLLAGQSLSKRRALSARDYLQSPGGGALLGFVLVSPD